MKKIYFKLLLSMMILLSLSFLPTFSESVSADTGGTVVAARGNVVAYGRLEKVNTRKQLKKAVARRVINLDSRIRLLVNRKAMKYSFNEYKKMLYEITDNQKFNEIMEHTSYWDIDSYNYNKNYYVWEFRPRYTINKSQAKKILAKVKPIIKTRKQLIKQVAKHVKNLDSEYTLNISSKLVKIENKASYTKFWDKLYANPTISDINHYRINFDDKYKKYKNYYKWRIRVKYNISKKEIKALDKFVNNWVANNINSGMTQEQKVRAINDFMVSEYRYTFGDNVKPPAKNAKVYPDGKLGKYSVYTCFSLLYGKGGVCDAKAKMFYRLAKKAGIKVLYITGRAGGMLHAWNMVNIDGYWYHVDVTWNRGHYEGTGENEYVARLDYYLKSDATMRKDHSWNAKNYPAANYDYPVS